jgi:acetyl-CoA synthetase
VQKQSTKGIVNEALEKCTCVETVLVVKRINPDISMKQGSENRLQPLGCQHQQNVKQK